MKRISERLVIACVALTLVLASAAVNAQPGGGPPRGPGGFGGPGGPGGPFGGGGVLGLVMRDEVRQELQLVDEQRDKVEGVVTAAREKIGNEMRDLFAQMRDLGDEERRARFNEIRTRMETLNKDMEAELQKVLLPHQFERLKQIDLQSRIQQRGAGALTSGELAEALSLTDEQREKLDARAAEVQQELRDKIAQLQLEARNKMLDVLTPEQRAKLDSLMGAAFALPDGGPGGFQGRGGRGGFGFGGRGGDGNRDRGGDR
jgi:Spy/CpxP family protein refolding chaperone